MGTPSNSFSAFENLQTSVAAKINFAASSVLREIHDCLNKFVAITVEHHTSLEKMINDDIMKTQNHFITSLKTYLDANSGNDKSQSKSNLNIDSKEFGKYAFPVKDGRTEIDSYYNRCNEVKMESFSVDDSKIGFAEERTKLGDLEKTPMISKCNFNQTNDHNSNSYSSNVKSLSLTPKEKDGAKRTKCAECKYETKDSGNLTRHITQVHHKIKAYNCDQCQYASTH